MRCPRCNGELEMALVVSCPEGALAPAQRDGDEIDKVVADMRRVIAACQPRKPGKAEETRHLMDHAGFKAPQALRVLSRLEGEEDIDREALRRYLKNGRKRAGCQFCP